MKLQTRYGYVAHQALSAVRTVAKVAGGYLVASGGDHDTAIGVALVAYGLAASWLSIVETRAEKIETKSQSDTAIRLAGDRAEGSPFR